MNCLEVITRAMRRIGVLAAGELPRDDERDDALATLAGLYSRLINEGGFGRIASIIPTGDYTAGENQRVIVSTQACSNVALPETISHNSAQRPIRDCAVVIVADHLHNLTTTYIRDAQSATWVDLSNLTATSPAPLADRDPTGLSSYLAVELADEYGQQASQTTIFNAARFQMSLTHRWMEEDVQEPGVFF